MSLPIPPRPLCVLVVEDEPLIRKLVTGLLRTLGVNVFSACDGLAAERLLRQRIDEIDTALIDLRLPGGDGISVRARLRELNPDLRCWLMTGSGREERTPLLGGFEGLLAKPFSLRSLEACLVAMRSGVDEGLVEACG